jgi:hypothetical protein
MGTNDLRQRALHFLGSGWASRAGRSLSRAECGYVLYTACGLGYMAFASWQITVGYQAHLEHLLAAHIARSLAAALGWCLPCLFVLVVGLGMAHEVAGAQARDYAGGEALEQRLNK